MTFISYAQNFEDVILWRALKHIQNGFYIDVGANDPKIDSVTKGFYDRGWRGINIEPVSQWFEKLNQDRPRDINLQLAAGCVQDELTFYEILDTGLSTMDRAIAEQYKSTTNFITVERKVSTVTLTEICQHYHIAPIHFLKIDVEGFEAQVLEGLDLSKIRPWIILVEATLPGTQKHAYNTWESVLLSANYKYVYEDGLNRFYLDEEHFDLKEIFSLPPNCFDDFSLSSTQMFCQHAIRKVNMEVHELTQNLHQEKAHSQELILRCALLDEQLKTLARRSEVAETQLYQIYKSKSWRITSPLRNFKALFKGLSNNSVHKLFRYSIINPCKKTLLIIERIIKRNHLLKKHCRRVLVKYPKLGVLIFNIFSHKEFEKENSESSEILEKVNTKDNVAFIRAYQAEVTKNLDESGLRKRFDV